MVFELVVLVAFPDPDPPDLEPDADNDAEEVIVVPDRVPEAEVLSETV